MTDTRGSLPPIDTRSRADQVIERIIDLIRSEGLTMGDPLPSERELGKLFGVSRSTIREAVRSLLGPGVVEARPGRGLYVGSRAVDDVPSVIIEELPAETQVSWELIEMRSVVELATTCLATRRRTDEDIQRLQSVLENLRAAFAANDLDAVVSADSAFHLAIAQASHNSMLAQTVISLEPVLRQQRRETFEKQMSEKVYSYSTVVGTHEAILNLIIAGDAKRAEEIMEDHLPLTWQSVTIWPLE